MAFLGPSRDWGSAGIVLLEVPPGWVEGHWDRHLSQSLPGTVMWDWGGMCFMAMGSGSLSLVLPQTIHIFTGIVHICFGIILTASEHRNPSLPVASGILFWLGILVSCDKDMGILGNPGGLGTISQDHQVSTDPLSPSISGCLYIPEPKFPAGGTPGRVTGKGALLLTPIPAVFQVAPGLRLIAGGK